MLLWGAAYCVRYVKCDANDSLCTPWFAVAPGCGTAALAVTTQIRTDATQHVTGDELPPTYQIRGPRVHFWGNGRSLAGTLYQPRPHIKLDSGIHQIEQQAYTSVLRAFKMQSDALTWEKESLITELRREWKVSDVEHRMLLNMVNEEEVVHRIRQSRQGGGMQSSLPHNSIFDHNHGPLKRQKKSHSMYSLPVDPHSPVMPLQAIVGNKTYSRFELAPENIRQSSAYQTIPHQGGWLASDGVMRGVDGRSRRYHANEYYASPNDMGLLNFNHIDIPNTETLVKKVERVLSDPDVYTIERAKKLLTLDQEQSLLDAIAKLDEASDRKNGICYICGLGTQCPQLELFGCRSLKHFEELQERDLDKQLPATSTNTTA
ncbi:protein EMSY-LIKE 3-like [Miscanthus floridulus]|uniref:protein EMSY-LIKE 3-like n=1 Tax=Miscanthus floridulus TaxID=154761 RepID=UPI00345A1B5E